MEPQGPPLLTPSPTEKRRAWVRSSRHWLTLEEGVIPQACEPQLDEVFLEGSKAGKIESWLQDCGSATEFFPEDSINRAAESFLKTGYSLEDDLTLGAEAIVLNRTKDEPTLGHYSLLPPPRPRGKQNRETVPLGSLTEKLNPFQFMSLGNSMASSGLSSGTSKTASSVSEILELCSEDAEEILYNLGFGQDELALPARIPTRFFNFPSSVQGINFRLFLESQLQRVREEDPCLSLASRFRQVEVLTTMANAFYSLYSHVSKTPVQKLAPPEFSFSSPMEKISLRFNSVRSEPRSPVDRLKDTISKMCLYTGSRESLGSPGPSPRASPKKRSSMPNVVERILEMSEAGTPKQLSRAGSGQDPAEGLSSSGSVGGSRSPVTGCALEPLWRSESGKFCQDVICPLIVEMVHKEPFACLVHTEMEGNVGSVGLTLQPSVGLGKTTGTREASSEEPVTVKAHRCLRDGSFPQSCTERGTRASEDVSRDPEAILDPVCRTTVNCTEGDLGLVEELDLSEITMERFGDSEQSGACAKLKESSPFPGYLCPGKEGAHTLKQENSFEMEEVQSTGEDDISLLEARNLMTSSPLSAVTTGHRDVILRGDSVQSDSSGFVEDDFQNQGQN
ncbi:protein ITPRID2 [Polyodon spathula]|uniref:protein ITPRID2 n=1 Tax=Polyodon spathula TaxID=7913 RepID=UPI001B7EF3CD|nr:protein ITPRID2 [Polyodon spathula]